MDGTGNGYILLWKETENVLLLSKKIKEHKNIKSPLKLTPPSMPKFILIKKYFYFHNYSKCT